MDSTAIKRIEELTIAGNHPDTDIPSIVLAGGNTLASLERYSNHPARHRAVVNTRRIDDFVRYAQDQLISTSVLFIDPDTLNAKLVFDYDGQWGEHIQNLELVYTPPYALVKTPVNFNQAQMREFIEDWDNLLTAHDAEGNAIPLSAALQALMKVEIKETTTTTSELTDFKATRSGLEEVEAKGLSASLPASLTLNTPLFEGMDPRAIVMRLSVKQGPEVKGKPTPDFGLRIQAHDRLKDEVIQELETKLKAIEVDTFIGKLVSHQAK